jgi:hypothetical protein
MAGGMSFPVCFNEIAMICKQIMKRITGSWLFHEYVPKFNREKKIYTDEIAIKAEAYTNRECINGYSISLKN